MSLKSIKGSVRLSLTCALLLAGNAPVPGETITSAQPVSQRASASSAASQPAAPVYDLKTIQRLQGYCHRSWQNARVDPQDRDDCTQDVLLRLMKQFDGAALDRAVNEADSEERRELNRSVWAATQRWRRRSRPVEFTEAPARPDQHGEWVARDEALQQVRGAIESGAARLSPVQREIVTRWSEGESIAVIAETLRLDPARVSDEKYKAIRKLRHCFSQEGSDVV